uniref:RNA-guided endonuclease TnpB family protein n=1 Tax=Streptomyces sp. WZ-12 TaxID=3030210 RepID=UPI002380D5CC|nr:RNA-guided endonuclease TnpB family protein [Streptomyces sp. WZ-12]
MTLPSLNRAPIAVYGRTRPDRAPIGRRNGLLRRATGIQSKCTGLQTGGEANLNLATRSVAESFQRSWIQLIRTGLSVVAVSVRIMQLRYAFRLSPTPGQRIALARAFGCARVVDNDAIAARERARAKKKLNRVQRDLSRKRRGAKKRAKARLKVARAHAQVADARREFPHQLATRLIRENQAVAVEDLAVKGLARTRLAKSVHDAGWSQFVGMPEYKAALYGRTFVKVGRFEPTSQVCSTCGHRDGPKPLDVREWTCTACGTVHDRDHNAALNVKQAAGLAVAACGAPIGPEPVLAQRTAAGSHGSPLDARAA